MNGRRVEALLAKLVLAALAVAFALGVAEWIARGFLETRSPIEQRFPVGHSRKPRPYVMFAGEPSTLGFNALGYPGEAPAMPKPAGEVRIFLLGGSTVVNGAPPISALLQQAFAERGLPQVRVYNFGVVSSVSTMELVQIVTEAVDLGPDLILMYNGGNDVLHPWSWDPRPGHPFNFAAFERSVLLEAPGRYPALRLLAFESAILRFLLRDYFLDAFVGLEALRREAGWGTESWKQALADVYVNNLDKASRVARAFGAGFVAFYQPLVYFKSPLAPEEVPLVADRAKAAFCRDMRGRIRARLAAAARSGLDVVDLSGIYDGDAGRVFEDAIHTVQAAKPTVVAGIFDHLVTRVSPSGR